jgi:hypothetical protein
MAYPTNMQIKISIASPDGDGSQQLYTASGNHTFAGGEGHQFTYTLATQSQNSIAGSANVTGSIYSYPSNCAVVALTGVPVVQSFTVN